jgi:hypothetical protein
MAKMHARRTEDSMPSHLRIDHYRRQRLRLRSQLNAWAFAALLLATLGIVVVELMS